MRLVSVIVLALAGLHLAAAVATGVGADETYYWLWSHYPTIGYYDHPPMVAWWIWLGTRLFGDTALGIRLVFVAATLLISLAVYAAGRVLYSERIGERAALWFNLSLLVGVAAIVATPDAPSALFWSLAILAFAMVVKTARGHWWLLVGLAAGLGASSKYTDLFLGPGLILALLVDRDLRRWFASPWLWAGGAVAVVTFAPVIWWNDQHGFVSFAKQFGRITADPFDPRYVLEFFATQFALLNPFAAVFVGVAAWHWLGRRNVPFRRETGILLATALPLAAYMLLHSFHARVEGNWLAPIYPTLALVAAAAADRAFGESASGRAGAFTRDAVVPFGVLMALIGLGYLAWPPPVKMPFDDPAQTFRGWRELAQAIDERRRDNGAAWIATTDYNVNAELAYQLRRVGLPVLQVTSRVRYAFAPAPDPALLGQPALLVVSTPSDELAMLTACFGSVTPVAVVPRLGPGNVPLEEFQVYLVAEPKAGIFADGCEAVSQVATR